MKRYSSQPSDGGLGVKLNFDDLLEKTPVVALSDEDRLNDPNHNESALRFSENQLRLLKNIFGSKPMDYKSFLMAINDVGYNGKMPSFRESDVRQLFARIAVNCAKYITWDQFSSFLILHMRVEQADVGADEYDKFSFGYLPQNEPSADGLSEHTDSITSIIAIQPWEIKTSTQGAAALLNLNGFSTKSGPTKRVRHFVTTSRDGCARLWSNDFKCISGINLGGSWGWTFSSAWLSSSQMLAVGCGTSGSYLDGSSGCIKFLDGVSAANSSYGSLRTSSRLDLSLALTPTAMTSTPLNANEDFLFVGDDEGGLSFFKIRSEDLLSAEDRRRYPEFVPIESLSSPRNNRSNNSNLSQIISKVIPLYRAGLRAGKNFPPMSNCNNTLPILSTTEVSKEHGLLSSVGFENIATKAVDSFTERGVGSSRINNSSSLPYAVNSNYPIRGKTETSTSPTTSNTSTKSLIRALEILNTAGILGKIDDAELSKAICAVQKCSDIEAVEADPSESNLQSFVKKSAALNDLLRDAALEAKKAIEKKRYEYKDAFNSKNGVGNQDLSGITMNTKQLAKDGGIPLPLGTKIKINNIMKIKSPAASERTPLNSNSTELTSSTSKSQDLQVVLDLIEKARDSLNSKSKYHYDNALSPTSQLSRAPTPLISAPITGKTTMFKNKDDLVDQVSNFEVTNDEENDNEDKSKKYKIGSGAEVEARLMGLETAEGARLFIQQLKEQAKQDIHNAAVRGLRGFNMSRKSSPHYEETSNEHGIVQTWSPRNNALLKGVSFNDTINLNDEHEDSDEILFPDSHSIVQVQQLAALLYPHGHTRVPIPQRVYGVRAVNMHNGPIRALKYVRDLQVLVSCGFDGAIKMSNPEAFNSAIVGSYPQPPGSDLPDTRNLKFAEHGVPVTTVNVHRRCVNAIEWSPEYKFFASGGIEKTVVVWNPFTKRAENILRGHDSPITGIAIHDDLYQLWSVSADKTTCIWDVRTWGKVATHNLDDEEYENQDDMDVFASRHDSEQPSAFFSTSININSPASGHPKNSPLAAANISESSRLRGGTTSKTSSFFISADLPTAHLPTTSGGLPLNAGLAANSNDVNSMSSESDSLRVQQHNNEQDAVDNNSFENNLILVSCSKKLHPIIVLNRGGLSKPKIEPSSSAADAALGINNQSKTDISVDESGIIKGGATFSTRPFLHNEAHTSEPPHPNTKSTVLKNKSILKDIPAKRRYNGDWSHALQILAAHGVSAYGLPSQSSMIATQLSEKIDSSSAILGISTHGNYIIKVLFSKAFSDVISVDLSGCLKVWDAHSGVMTFCFRRAHNGHKLTNASLDLSHRRVITCAATDDCVKVWNYSSGELLKKLLLSPSSIEAPVNISLATSTRHLSKNENLMSVWNTTGGTMENSNKNGHCTNSMGSVPVVRGISVAQAVSDGASLFIVGLDSSSNRLVVWEDLDLACPGYLSALKLHKQGISAVNAVTSPSLLSSDTADSSKSTSLATQHENNVSPANSKSDDASSISNKILSWIELKFGNGDYTSSMKEAMTSCGLQAVVATAAVDGALLLWGLKDASIDGSTAEILGEGDEDLLYDSHHEKVDSNTSPASISQYETYLSNAEKVNLKNKKGKKIEKGGSSHQERERNSSGYGSLRHPPLLDVSKVSRGPLSLRMNKNINYFSTASLHGAVNVNHGDNSTNTTKNNGNIIGSINVDTISVSNAKKQISPLNVISAMSGNRTNISSNANDLSENSNLSTKKNNLQSTADYSLSNNNIKHPVRASTPKSGPHPRFAPRVPKLNLSSVSPTHVPQLVGDVSNAGVLSGKSALQVLHSQRQVQNLLDKQNSNRGYRTQEIGNSPRLLSYQQVSPSPLSPITLPAATLNGSLSPVPPKSPSSTQALDLSTRLPKAFLPASINSETSPRTFKQFIEESMRPKVVHENVEKVSRTNRRVYSSMKKTIYNTKINSIADQVNLLESEYSNRYEDSVSSPSRSGTPAIARSYRESGINSPTIPSFPIQLPLKNDSSADTNSFAIRIKRIKDRREHDQLALKLKQEREHLTSKELALINPKISSGIKRNFITSNDKTNQQPIAPNEINDKDASLTNPQHELQEDDELKDITAGASALKPHEGVHDLTPLSAQPSGALGSLLRGVSILEENRKDIPNRDLPLLVLRQSRHDTLGSVVKSTMNDEGDFGMDITNAEGDVTPPTGTILTQAQSRNNNKIPLSTISMEKEGGILSDMASLSDSSNDNDDTSDDDNKHARRQHRLGNAATNSGSSDCSPFALLAQQLRSLRGKFNVTTPDSAVDSKRKAKKLKADSSQSAQDVADGKKSLSYYAERDNWKGAYDQVNEWYAKSFNSQNSATSPSGSNIELTSIIWSVHTGTVMTINKAGILSIWPPGGGAPLCSAMSIRPWEYLPLFTERQSTNLWSSRVIEYRKSTTEKDDGDEHFNMKSESNIEILPETTFLRSKQVMASNNVKNSFSGAFQNVNDISDSYRLVQEIPHNVNLPHRLQISCATCSAVVWNSSSKATNKRSSSLDSTSNPTNSFNDSTASSTSPSKGKMPGNVSFDRSQNAEHHNRKFSILSHGGNSGHSNENSNQSYPATGESRSWLAVGTQGGRVYIWDYTSVPTCEKAVKQERQVLSQQQIASERFQATSAYNETILKNYLSSSGGLFDEKQNSSFTNDNSKHQKVAASSSYLSSNQFPQSSPSEDYNTLHILPVLPPRVQVLSLESEEELGDMDEHELDEALEDANFIKNKNQAYQIKNLSINPEDEDDADVHLKNTTPTTTNLPAAGATASLINNATHPAGLSSTKTSNVNVQNSTSRSISKLILVSSFRAHVTPVESIVIATGSSSIMPNILNKKMFESVMHSLPSAYIITASAHRVCCWLADGTQIGIFTTDILRNIDKCYPPHLNSNIKSQSPFNDYSKKEISFNPTTIPPSSDADISNEHGNTTTQPTKNYVKDDLNMQNEKHKNSVSSSPKIETALTNDRNPNIFLNSNSTTTWDACDPNTWTLEDGHVRHYRLLKAQRKLLRKSLSLFSDFRAKEKVLRSSNSKVETSNGIHHQTDNSHHDASLTALISEEEQRLSASLQRELELLDFSLLTSSEDELGPVGYLKSQIEWKNDESNIKERGRSHVHTNQLVDLIGPVEFSILGSSYINLRDKLNSVSDLFSTITPITPHHLSSFDKVSINQSNLRKGAKHSSVFYWDGPESELNAFAKDSKTTSGNTIDRIERNQLAHDGSEQNANFAKKVAKTKASTANAAALKSALSPGNLLKLDGSIIGGKFESFAGWKELQSQERSSLKRKFKSGFHLVHTGNMRHSQWVYRPISRSFPRPESDLPTKTSGTAVETTTAPHINGSELSIVLPPRFGVSMKSHPGHISGQSAEDVILSNVGAIPENTLCYTRANLKPFAVNTKLNNLKPLPLTPASMPDGGLVNSNMVMLTTSNRDANYDVNDSYSKNLAFINETLEATRNWVDVAEQGGDFIQIVNEGQQLLQKQANSQGKQKKNGSKVKPLKNNALSL